MGVHGAKVSLVQLNSQTEIVPSVQGYTTQFESYQQTKWTLSVVIAILHTD